MKEFFKLTKRKLILMIIIYVLLLLVEHFMFILPGCASEILRICDLETQAIPTIHIPLTCINVCTSEEIKPIILYYYPKYFLFPLLISYLLSCLNDEFLFKKRGYE